jgi:hypothetical protein
MARTLIALGSVLALASACATPAAPAGGTAQMKAQSGAPPLAAKTAGEDEQKLVCQMERPVGSNISRKVCRTPEQIEQDREAAQEAMRGVQQGTSRESN